MGVADILKLFFTSDLHLGITTWGKLNPVTGVNTMVEKYVQELRESLRRLIEARASVWIIAGDVFHVRTPANYVRQAFTEIVQEALDNGIEVYVMLGNHDQLISLGTRSNLGEVAVLKIPGLKVIEKSCIMGIKGLTVVFLPWQPKPADIVADAQRLIAQVAPTEMAIVVGHFSVDGAEIGTEKMFELQGSGTVPKEALIDPKIKVVMLGHIHKRQVLKKKGLIQYIGSMERIDMSERGQEKGSTLLTVDFKAKEIDIDFIEGTAQRYEQIDIDLTATEDLTFKSLDRSIVEGAVVKLVIKCSEEQRRKIDMQALDSKLEKAKYIDIKWIIPKDGERTRDNRVTKDIDISQALELWLAKQDLTDETRQKVLVKGQKLLQEEDL
jgi:exonuclease SbcD